MSRFAELEAFVAIARAGSISRAAAQLHLAKSAVSRRLADLEARLGTQLVTRTTRQSSLTEAGMTFLARAEALLDDLAEAEASVQAGTRALTGKLRVAAPLSFGVAHLRPIVSAFIRDNPGLDMEIDFSDRRVNLVEEGFDLALRIGSLTDSSLIARKVRPVDLWVAAAPAFWDTHGRPTHPDDLSTLDALLYSNRPRPTQLSWWGPGGTTGSVNPNVRLLAGNGTFLADLATQACGFVEQPDFILAPYIECGELERVLTDYAFSDIHLFVVFPPTRRITARARAFADAVVEAFAG